MPQVPLASATSDALAGIGVLLGLALALLYALRARALARAGSPLPPWRQLAYYAGLLLAALTILLLNTPGRRMADWHAVSDLLIGDLAPVLLVLGLSASVLRPFEGLLSARFVRALWSPLAAFPIWALDFYGWHLPKLYEAALRHNYVHAVQYLTTFAAGVVMWVCLLGPVPRPRWFGDGAKLLYVVAVRLAAIVLGNLLLWAGGIVYPYYLQQDAQRQISPVADQNLAGAAILIDQAIVLLVVFAWLYLRARSADAEKPRRASSLTPNGSAPGA